MRAHAWLIVLCAAGCSGAPPPPASTSYSPGKSPQIASAPWQARLSVADGYEAKHEVAPPVVIKGATLMLATGKTISRGTIVLEKGKIAVVAEGDLPAPVGATVIDGTGKFVTPGIIDTHSHLGVYPMLETIGTTEGNEATDPVTPWAQTADAFWPQDPGIERAVAGGVTTIQVLPGSANSIGGRAITIKMRPGNSPREMHFPGAPDGLKMACGENPKRVYGKGKTPGTRMGNVALQRGAFLRAKKLIEQWARYRDAEKRRAESEQKKRDAYEAKRDERVRREAWCKQNEEIDPCESWRKSWAASPLEEPVPADAIAPPDRDTGLETLAAAIEGRVLVHVHCYRADDMLDMMALSDEIGFKIRSFHHALEAFKIRDKLAERQIGVSTWADWWGFKMEAFDGIPENAGLFQEAGGRPIIHSDSAEGIQRLNQEAAKALAHGRAAGASISEEDAIRWVTINPAWALGVDHRVGTLEAGKDADVVLWDKSPFSVYASAEKVFIDGALVYSKGAQRWSDFELGQPSATAKPLAAPASTAITPVASGTAVAPKKTTVASTVAIAVTGATVHTGNGQVIEDATIVLENGLIRDVGKGVAVPAGAESISAKGMVVTPGLVDPLTSIGIVEVDLEGSTHDDSETKPDAVHAGFKASEGYNPLSVVIPIARSEGLTSAGAIPHGGLISGRSAWADLDGESAADAIAKDPIALHVHLEAGASGDGHAQAIAKVREAFDDARTFVKNRAAWERNQSRALAASRLDLEALASALDGKLPVVFHVNRAADITATLKLAKELKLKPVIAGGAEAWRIASDLAAAKVPVIVYPLVDGPENFDTVGARDDNAARLAAAGVTIALSTGETQNARKLRQEAGNAVRAGLPLEAAIQAITRAPAQIYGLDAKYGTIEKGKVANLVVWSADPLELSTRVVSVIIKGKKLSLRTRQTDLLDKYRHLAK